MTLQDENGVWKSGDYDVGKIISNYFSNIFTTPRPSDMEDALAGISATVTEEANNVLVVVPSTEEIREALFQMHLNKAPGIDGMHTLFYQRFWHIIGVDIMRLIVEWWNGDADIGLWNKTYSGLIPKCQNPQQMGDCYKPL